LITFSNRLRVEKLESEHDVFISMQWYTPTDWVDFTESRIFTDEMSFFETYLLFYYYGILTLSINELGPVNPSEMCFSVVSMIISLMLNSFLFSDMAVIATFLQ
jgi:hypothetical protein